MSILRKACVMSTWLMVAWLAASHAVAAPQTKLHPGSHGHVGPQS